MGLSVEGNGIVGNSLAGPLWVAEMPVTGGARAGKSVFPVGEENEIERIRMVMPRAGFGPVIF